MSTLANRRHSSTVFLFAALALVVSLLAATTATKAVAVGEDSGGVFVPVTPTRIADTMAGTNTSATPISSGGVRSINVLGVGGVPSTGVGAVVLDVAGSSNAGAAVYAYPDGTTRGGSFLKIDANDGWDSNTVIVKPGSNGKVAFYNSYGSTELNVDVQGYFTNVSGEGSPGGFVPITPSRILSSYAGIGVPLAKFKGGTTTQFQVGGVGDIPADATAVFGNVRVFDSNYSGAAKILASNATVNSSYSINFVTNEFNDTGLSMKLGTDGKIKIVLNGSISDTAHLIIDVQGYFTPDPESGGSFTPLTQDRIFDSRSTVPIPANGSVEVPVAGHGGVPNDDNVGSVVVSVLALNWHATGSVRIYNADQAPPASTNLAFTAPYDRDVISTSVVELSDEGSVIVQNLSGGSVDVILDGQGWFSAPNDEPELPAMTSYGVDESILEDMRVIAADEGISLQAAVDKYGWQNAFSDIAGEVQAAHPTTFAGASINTSGPVGGTITFKGAVPSDVNTIVAGSPVPITLNGGMDHSQAQLGNILETAHNAVIAQAGTTDVNSHFDRAAGVIRSTVINPDAGFDSAAASDSVSEEVQDSLEPTPVPEVEITTSVDEGQSGEDWIRGGAILTVYGTNIMTCTSAFPVLETGGSSSGGLITAAHCDNNIWYSGRNSLTYVRKLPANHGDIQYMRGSEGIGQTFYYAVGKYRRITGLGTPSANQTLCHFGRGNDKQTCDEVKDVLTCRGSFCNLVAMKHRRSSGGNSGGPWYSGGRAYGVHSGYDWIGGAKRDQFTPIYNTLLDVSVKLSK
ncbi:hypothetical protein [Aeromicrobium sp.]|uniref:hypothetical protein n=1 Tax=Aeromicrobium sp. TaxID=1871063 RepID=UPI002FCA5BEA